jgi:hypothetical protein
MKRVLSALLLVANTIWRAVCKITWAVGRWLVGVSVVLIIIGIFFFVLDTKRDIAYRYSTPGSHACNAQRANLTALASKEVDNNELTVYQTIPGMAANDAYSCMLQEHALKPELSDVDHSTVKGNPSLRHFLSFIEFRENGTPVQTSGDGTLLGKSQLKVLLEHLRTQKENGKQNFVFAFIHGWRHDARIGDENVKNVRLMAAYLTSFLQQRCETYSRYCNVAVSVVYIGWRGARLNEVRIQNMFGGYFKDTASALSDFFASMTLFDRKPVSEQIAPAVISALNEIDKTIHKPNTNWYERPRLITIGHSLGGNMLAFGLKERMIEIVKDNDDFDKPADQKTLVRPPFGDLIVLLNPASEAENWIAIQRAFRERIKAEVTTEPTKSKVRTPAFQNAYSFRQPPIYMALTAAHYWPANNVQPSDVDAIEKKIHNDPGLLKRRSEQHHDPSENNKCAAIRVLDGEYKPNYDYDSATYNLFPLYKLDLRPYAKTLEEIAHPDPYDCNEDSRRRGKVENIPSQPNFIAQVLVLGLSGIMRNFPFQNTDVLQTRTIGNLDPTRSPFGELFDAENDPATWYGTTHELSINAFKESTGTVAPSSAVAIYADAVSPEKSQCAVVDKWLSTARTERGIGKPPVNWDSGYSKLDKDGKVGDGEPNTPNLTKIRPSGDPNLHIESQFRQTLYFSGFRDISGANDPFWNVRAFQTAMTSHNGYVSYPLICTIFQFVMDKVTADETPPPSPR